MERVVGKADELDLNTGILAWMRVGQIYDLKGKHAEAVDAYMRSIALAPESDAARAPKRYIASPYKRTPPAAKAALFTECSDTRATRLRRNAAIPSLIP